MIGISSGYSAHSQGHFDKPEINNHEFPRETLIYRQIHDDFLVGDLSNFKPFSQKDENKDNITVPTVGAKLSIF